MSYRWQPIDRTRQEIRVLDLNAGIGTCDLVGHLRHVFLDDPEKPLYETISYAWGDATLVSSIMIEGHCVPISASAASALHCMRSPDMVRTLWIDCICIDQNNDREKGHQVYLIADIFQNSRQTLAFLGDGDSTVKRAFDGLTMIHDALLDPTRGAINLRLVHQTTPDKWHSIRDKIDFMAIDSVTQRPYFERLWIVQEAVLSGRCTLFCGEWKIDFNTFVAAACWLSFSGKAFVHEEVHLVKAAAFLNLVRLASSPIGPTITGILCVVTTLLCSEPRDPFFGLLGLLKASKLGRVLSVDLVPDYTKSIVDVYCDATRACFQNHNDVWALEWFGYEPNPDNIIEGLPTWVPNWYDSEGSKYTPHRAINFPRHTSIWVGEAREVPLFPIPSIGRVLKIAGVSLETILRQSDFVVTPTDFSREAQDMFLSGARDLLPNCHSSSRTGSDHERLNYILSAGCQGVDVYQLWDDVISLAFPPANEKLRHSDSRDLQPPRQAHLDPGADELADYSPAMKRVLNEKLVSFCKAAISCQNRKCFITRSGRLGMGPRTLQQGDVIAVSPFSQWPMVLRRAEHFGDDHYTMLGAAFVEGVTSGKEVFAKAARGTGIGTIHLV